ncbi:DMT family transporter [Actinophytocola oryzae]|uniref:Transporter family-2 protein n=1 Tax=Actinophytocola oryzae TaxID=502181 RepID=A0A4R7UYX7_9PSEU|nr:DMT family transporter [Actinophytocola oryzae]TDV41414.1 transporter family-2 protein [Actinophytocola oryzae]
MSTAVVSPAHHPSARLRAAGAALAALGGVALAVQGRINGQLGHQLQDGVVAALISFSVGSVLLLAVAPILPGARAGVGRLRKALREQALRPWQMLGGACGAFLVTTQGVTVQLLGVAVFTVAVVAGQVVCSLPVDRAGLGPGGPQPITLPRAVGASLAVIAVIISVSDQGIVTASGGLWWAALPAVAGAGLAWQGAMNGRVRAAADDVVVPTVVNFLVGTCALVLAACVDVIIKGWPATPPDQWYLYVGGTLGIVAIMTAVSAVRVTGVLLLGMASVTGQLVGAVLLDIFVPTTGGLSVTTVVGIALTMVAVGIAAIRRRPR